MMNAWHRRVSKFRERWCNIIVCVRDRDGCKCYQSPKIYLSYHSNSIIGPVHFIISSLACQPGVARAFALRAELRPFAPLAGSAQLSRFAITQASDELSYKKLTFSKCSCGRGFWEAGKARIFSSLSSFKGHVHRQLFVLTTYDR